RRARAAAGARRTPGATARGAGRGGGAAGVRDRSQVVPHRRHVRAEAARWPRLRLRRARPRAPTDSRARGRRRPPRSRLRGLSSSAAPEVAAARGTVGLGRDELRSEEHTSELQSRSDLVCRLLLEKKKTIEACNRFIK